MDASNIYLFRTLKTLAKVKVKDKISTRGRQVKINPPTRWWDWYYRWRETREKNIEDLEHILSLVFEKLMFLRSQPRTAGREKIVRKFVKEMRDASKGIQNLHHTYNDSADTLSGIEHCLEAIRDCCVETTEWLEYRGTSGGEFNQAFSLKSREPVEPKTAAAPVVEPEEGNRSGGEVASLDPGLPAKTIDSPDKLVDEEYSDDFDFELQEPELESESEDGR